MLKLVPQSVGTIALEQENLSLARNFAWTLAGNVLYALSQWGILIAIAKLGTAKMLGQFALGLAVSAPVFMFTTLQLRAVLVTDTDNEYRLGHYFAVRILGTGAGLIGITGLIAIAGFHRETALVVFLVSLAKAAETFSDIIYGFWQKHERFEKIAIALTSRGVGSLASVTAVLYFTRNIAWSVVAMAAVWTLWLVTYERTGAKRLLAHLSTQDCLSPEWQWNKCKSLAVLALPLGIVILLLSLNANMPRYFIEHYMGEGALGYFAALAYIFVAGNTLMAALGQSALPRLVQHFKFDPAAFVRLLMKMVLIAVSLGVAGICMAISYGSPILQLLYRSDYAKYASVFTWLMTAAAVAYASSMLGYGMTAARAFRAQVPLFLIAILITALACNSLIPSSGLMGGALAMLIGGVVACAGSAYIIFAALRRRRSRARC